MGKGFTIARKIISTISLLCGKSTSQTCSDPIPFMHMHSTKLIIVLIWHLELTWTLSRGALRPGQPEPDPSTAHLGLDLGSFQLLSRPSLDLYSLIDPAWTDMRCIYFPEALDMGLTFKPVGAEIGWILIPLSPCARLKTSSSLAFKHPWFWGLYVKHL